MVAVNLLKNPEICEVLAWVESDRQVENYKMVQVLMAEPKREPDGKKGEATLPDKRAARVGTESLCPKSQWSQS